MNQNQAHQAWLQAAEKVKDRVIAPTLYRALELGVGITLEDDYFVLGFSSADIPMAGHLRSSQHLTIIEQSISEVVKRKVRLRIVEGTTVADYENFKRLQAVAEASRSTMSDRRNRERAIEQAWDEVSDKITRGYTKLELRQLAQSKAVFMRHCFKFINEAIDRLGYTDQSDEMQKRALGRVFEKFASLVEVPSALLAYEFFKLRDEGKLH